MADGFIGRWSRRKQEARAGLPLEEPLKTEGLPLPMEPASERVSEGVTAAPADSSSESVAKVALPTLKDVKALTAESDFSPFVAPDVDPEVRNAAMKKLFADPHYNVMDGLDTYIEDYSKPDPIPDSMLRQMVSAKFLNLFDEDKDKDKDKDQAASATQPLATVPAAVEPVALPDSTQADHDHTDLRLQQDHASGAQGSGNSAG